MKPSVYLETTIIGYLAMRPSQQLITAANQLVTRDWWDRKRTDFNLFISQAVIDECSAGDPIAAQERLAFLDGIPLLASTPAVNKLAQSLVAPGPIPPKAKVDAAHLAFAAMNGMDYLLTWNCRHIANPSMRKQIVASCHAFGIELPTLCTPQQLIAEYYDPMQDE
jgi:hypothetical protein